MAYADLFYRKPISSKRKKDFNYNIFEKTY